MRRTTIALLAGLEASVAALIGLGIALVPLMLLWAVHFGLAVDAAVFLRAAADVWLLGHGVDLVLQLDPVTAGRIGLPGAGDPFAVTIALLGFALLSVAFGRRIGRARSRADTPSPGASPRSSSTRSSVPCSRSPQGSTVRAPIVWQAARLPAFVMALGVVIGAVGGASGGLDDADAAGGVMRRVVTGLPPALVTVARQAVRIGAGTAFGVLGVAGVLVAVLIAPTTRRSPASTSPSAPASTAASRSRSADSRCCRMS